MQPTTESLCRSRPAQCACRTSIAPPHAPQAWNPHYRKSNKRAPELSPARGIIWGAQGVPGPTHLRAHSHQGMTDLCAAAQLNSTTGYIHVSSPAGRLRRWTTHLTRTALSMKGRLVVKERGLPEGRSLIVDVWSATGRLAWNRHVGSGGVAAFSSYASICGDIFITWGSPILILWGHGQSK